MRASAKELRSRSHELLEAVSRGEEVVITYRGKAELNTLRNFLQSQSVPVLHVTESISSTVMFLVEQHHFSHSLGFSDAIIAATAVSHGLPLMTANTKHYRVIENLILKKFLP